MKRYDDSPEAIGKELGRTFADIVKISTEPKDKLIAELVTACKVALAHVEELREAWRTGALSERDGHGGTRSNRNVEVEGQLRAAIAKAKPAGVPGKES